MQNKKTIKELISEVQERTRKPTVQTVRPKTEKDRNLVQCNFELHPETKRKLKMKALVEGKTIKELITEAIENIIK